MRANLKKLMHVPHPTELYRPSAVHGHHRLRAAMSLVAAVAGGLAFLGIALAIVTATGPSEAPEMWIAIGVLLLVWLSGIWWRWDSPDHRDTHAERERRGF